MRAPEPPPNHEARAARLSSGALPLALVAAGVLWLLVETGFVPDGLTRALLVWWPLLLIAVGTDILAPDLRPWRIPYLGFAAVAVLVLGAFGIGAPGPPRTTTAHAFLSPSARTLRAEIDLGSAHGTIAAATEADVLLDAEFTGRPSAQVDVDGLSDAILRVRPASGVRAPLPRGATWRVALAPSLPTTLDLRTGAGGASINLAAFALDELDLRTGSGDVTLTLPGRGEGVTARLDGGNGHLDIDILEGASLDVVAELGAGGATLTIAAGSDVRVLVASGSGDLLLDLPDDAPIRLEVLEDGTGRVDVGSALQRRVGSGDTGIWQSAALERGGRVIDVRVVGVGAGSITVR